MIIQDAAEVVTSSLEAETSTKPIAQEAAADAADTVPPTPSTEQPVTNAEETPVAASERLPATVYAAEAQGPTVEREAAATPAAPTVGEAPVAAAPLATEAIVLPAPAVAPEARAESELPTKVDTAEPPPAPESPAPGEPTALLATPAQQVLEAIQTSGLIMVETSRNLAPQPPPTVEANEPAPRRRRPAIVIPDEPLVMVETRKQASQ